MNCAGVIETLLEKRLITTAGRKQVIGRPILYRTSKDFLMRFGLGDLDELPSLKEFEALAREALGADDGIAAEAPPEETAAESSGPAAPESASPSTPDAGAVSEVSGESPALREGAAPASASELRRALKEDATRDSESRGANQAVAGKTPRESTGRAAKQAAPGSSQ